MQTFNPTKNERILETSMNTHIMLLIALPVLACFSAWGQQNEREVPRRPRTTLNRGNWIGRRVMTQDFMDKVGIQGEQAAKLKAELDALDKQSQALDEEIGQAAQEQGEIAKRVLSEAGANTDEIMKIIERIGKSRTEQAKLATKRLIVIRDNLTPAQREKASALLNEEQKKWHEEREARDKNAQPNRPAGQADRPAAPKGW